MLTVGENAIYTAVANYVIANDNTLTIANFSGEYTDTPSAFPNMTGYLIEDVQASETIDSSNEEKFTDVTFEWTVYTNDTHGKKERAKKLSSLIDTKMRRLGFTRTFMQNVPNFADATIYRIVLRYTGRIQNSTNLIYRR